MDLTQKFNKVFLDFFLSCHQCDKTLICWAIIQDTRTTEDIFNKFIIPNFKPYDKNDYNTLKKEWKEYQEGKYILDYNENNEVYLPQKKEITTNSIEPLKRYFEKYDGTLLVDLVYSFIRHNNIYIT